MKEARPRVGGYRENGAMPRVPHGPFSRHGTRQRRNNVGPDGHKSWLQERDAGRREPHTRLAHVQDPSREQKPRFFLAAPTYSPFLSCSRLPCTI